MMPQMFTKSHRSLEDKSKRDLAASTFETTKNKAAAVEVIIKQKRDETVRLKN